MCEERAFFICVFLFFSACAYIPSHLIVKAETMLNIIKEIESPFEKKMTAVNNLIVVARERVGADIIMSLKGPHTLYQAMKLLQNEDFNHGSVRIFGEICRRGVNQSLNIIKTLGRYRIKR